MPDLPPATIARAPRRTQAERTEQTRRKIMRSAIELIAELGCDRTSLAAIGEHAGYSRGVVTSCYGSKSALLGALVGYMFDSWQRNAVRPAVATGGGLRALCTVIDLVRDQVLTHPKEQKAFYLLLFEALGALPELRPDIMAFHARIREECADWFRAAAENGEVDPQINPEAQAALFVGTFRGIMYQHFLDPDAIDLTAMLSEFKRNLGGSFQGDLLS